MELDQEVKETANSRAIKKAADRVAAAAVREKARDKAAAKDKIKEIN
jgi:hypothetical protein